MINWDLIEELGDNAVELLRQAAEDSPLGWKATPAQQAEVEALIASGLAKHPEDQPTWLPAGCLFVQPTMAGAAYITHLRETRRLAEIQARLSAQQQPMEAAE